MIRVLAILFTCLFYLAPVEAFALSGYASFAKKVLTGLPDNAEPRPDLEAYLSSMASSYRKSKSRKGLIASDLMREMARAQAADMMTKGRSGHSSSGGFNFGQRFGGYVEDIDLYRARGENAASERHKGDPDKTKARRLFQLWLDSGGHRRNLMSADYEYVSTGVIQHGDELWAVQVFWSRPIEPGSSPLFQIQ
jgi:uncharacterized protein YkwD